MGAHPPEQKSVPDAGRECKMVRCSSRAEAADYTCRHREVKEFHLEWVIVAPVRAGGWIEFTTLGGAKLGGLWCVPAGTGVIIIGVQLMKVADFTQGRDNNFNLLRILAAYAVLVGHGFPLTIGKTALEPLGASLGMSIGMIAVDVFFMTSGFLVTASLLARKSTVEFVWARVLRIFPALFVMLVLTVFGLGVFFTTLSPSSYLLDYWTRTYFIRGLTLFFGVSYELPGVFATNPYDHVVNGSLWTMPYELRMYVTLAVAWALLSLVPRARSWVFPVLVVLAAIASGVGVLAARFGLLGESKWLGFFFMFFSGAAFYMLRARIHLSSMLFVACLCAWAIAAVTSHTAFSWSTS